jgi:hypothetical protein
LDARDGTFAGRVPELRLAGRRGCAADSAGAYDGGAEFSGDALMKLVVQLHAAGTKFQWSVMEPKVHVTCDIAWITYVNRGSVEDATRTELTWLESAVLNYDGTRWRIRFFHSTPVLKPPKQ